MDMTFEDVYNFLESNKKDLNFIRRDDMKTEQGTSKFSTLFWDEAADKKDIPLDIKNFLMKVFNITEKDYSFIQIQKYEIGEYILPHVDSYPLFNLLTISSSNLDGLVLEGDNNIFKFIPDQAGNLVNVPKYRWHWVNPVREKTRYSAVYGLKSLTDYDDFLNE
jgi:hypothetical protein